MRFHSMRIGLALAAAAATLAFTAASYAAPDPTDEIRGPGRVIVVSWRIESDSSAPRLSTPAIRQATGHAELLPRCGPLSLIGVVVVAAGKSSPITSLDGRP